MLRNVPLFGVGNTGKSVNVNAQRRVNLFVEVQEDPEANGICLFPMPGLTTLTNLGANPARGLYVKGDLMYAVVGSTLYEIAGNGTTTARGTLTSSAGRVDITDNGAQMLLVDGTTTGYVYTFASTAFASVTLPIAATNCTFMNGYGVIGGGSSAQFNISSPYDFTTWDPTNFATAESDPDNLVRLVQEAGVLVLFGEKTTEFWGDSGTADFPFARIGANAIEWGLAARWSLCKFDGSLMFLRRNRLGAVQVCRLSGNDAVPVSNPEMDYVFSTYVGVENATALSFMVSGHPMYQINFPTPGESWIYDGRSNEWHRAQYGASSRHRAEIQVNFLNRPYVSDWENGKIYLLDQTAETDDGQYIVREFVSRHNKTGNLSRVAQLWLEMEAGVGLATGQGSDPKVMLQISRDGGHTWGTELWRSIGAMGEYRKRALWNALGHARDWLFKFRVTDPVKVVFVAAWARIE